MKIAADMFKTPTFANGQVPPPPTPVMNSLGSAGLLDRIRERKRAVLGDVSNSGEPVRTRARIEIAVPTPTAEEDSGDKVAVQRFTLVSRGAPAARRTPAEHTVLLAPSRVAAQLGSEVQLCRCSDCDRSGLRRRMSGTRMCRRNTEAHPEYALLLNMNDRFESECPARASGYSLVTEACCREKTAFFILGAGATTVGYVAAELVANRKAKRMQESKSSDEVAQIDDIPTLLQIYVEPEFRRKGYAMEALKLLLRDHQTLRIDDPTDSVVHLLRRLGYASQGRQETPAGVTLTQFVRAPESVDAGSERLA